ncbi:MAG: hypothetical protein ABSD64_03520 [Terriglobales bacterium]|jgi:hypothetical protein
MKAPRGIRARDFLWLCLKEAARTSWEKADTGATVIGFILPAVIHFVPRWESAMSNLAWQAPIACLASITLTRLLISPFLVYRRRDSEAGAAEKALKDLQSKEEMRHLLAEMLAEGAELRRSSPDTVAALRAWKESIGDWVIATAIVLDEFSSTTDSVIFKNADASGAGVGAEPSPIRSIDDLQEWVPYLDQKLQKHQLALEEILTLSR